MTLFNTQVFRLQFATSDHPLALDNVRRINIIDASSVKAIQRKQHVPRSLPPTTAPNLPSPAEVWDSSDPGDELHRNLRYQHACGVILLIRSITGEESYIAIWCEHHDDLLCERADGLFDSYQIKTRKPENGEWKVTDGEIQRSVKKFLKQDQSFPGKMEKFHFVSNAAFLESDAVANRGKCPTAFVDEVREFVANGTKLTDECQTTFDGLVEFCGCEPDALATVLVRTVFIVGPERRSFDSAIAHEFLPKIPGCDSLQPHELNALRDSLISRVNKAASLSTDEPDKYWICQDQSDADNPFLIAKKIGVEGVLLDLQDNEFRIPIRLDGDAVIGKLIGNLAGLTVLEKKLIFAGLAEQLETARSRTIAAERHLLELVDKLGHAEFQRRLAHLEALVRGTCDDSKVLTETSDPPFRSAMYRETLSELKSTAKDRPEMVYREPFEFLMGLAGLLTEDCQVWWSEEFDLGVMK